MSVSGTKKHSFITDGYCRNNSWKKRERKIKVLKNLKHLKCKINTQTQTQQVKLNSNDWKISNENACVIISNVFFVGGGPLHKWRNVWKPEDVRFGFSFSVFF